jgi:hypothetical protein
MFGKSRRPCRFPSIPGTQYSIQITGQNNQSSSFFQFLVDPDGPGTASGFVPLGNNVNFGNGFNTITLATFTDLGTSDFFRIINGGTGNSGGQISGLSITAQHHPADDRANQRAGKPDGRMR